MRIKEGDHLWPHWGYMMRWFNFRDVCDVWVWMTQGHLTGSVGEEEHHRAVGKAPALVGAADVQAAGIAGRRDWAWSSCHGRASAACRCTWQADRR